MEEKIKQIIDSIRSDIDFEDTDLEISEEMDSMDLIALITELEDEFDIEITMEEKTEENFKNPESIAAMVKRLQEE